MLRPTYSYWQNLKISSPWCVFDSSPYVGQLWRPDLPLLGVVRWSCWLWGGCSSFPPSTPPHRSAPSGSDGDPLQSEPAAPHVPGGWAHQSPPYPDIPARPHQGCLSPRRCRCPRLTQHATHTLLHREESFAREPGDRSHRECFQGYGKRGVLGMK